MAKGVRADFSPQSIIIPCNALFSPDCVSNTPPTSLPIPDPSPPSPPSSPKSYKSVAGKQAPQEAFECSLRVSARSITQTGWSREVSVVGSCVGMEWDWRRFLIRLGNSNVMILNPALPWKQRKFFIFGRFIRVFVCLFALYDVSPAKVRFNYRFAFRAYYPRNKNVASQLSMYSMRPKPQKHNFPAQHTHPRDKFHHSSPIYLRRQARCEYASRRP